MNSRSRTMGAINGLPHDRVPVAQHSFAFVIERAGLSMKEFAFNPDKAAQALADTAIR
jgi:uroporphyrinogen-III decarboxylase